MFMIWGKYVGFNDDDMSICHTRLLQCVQKLDEFIVINIIEGWGTNEGLIISILGHRNAAQRKLIRQTYAETFGEDLLKALEKELTNDFEVSFGLHFLFGLRRIMIK